MPICIYILDLHSMFYFWSRAKTWRKLEVKKHNQTHDTKAQENNTKAQKYDTKSVSFRNFWSSTKNRSSQKKKRLIGTIYIILLFIRHFVYNIYI